MSSFPSKFENLVLQSNVSSMDNFVSKQLKKISSKYGLDVKDVTEAFNDGVSNAVKQLSSGDKKEGKSKNDNKKQCIETIKTTGAQCTAKVSDKSETGNYCGRHLNKEKPEGEKKEKKKSGSKGGKKLTKKELLKEQNTDVIKKLNDGKQKVSLSRNQYGNFEHPETHFVFNRDTSEVIGKQVGSEVKQLTASDIETCKARNFKYQMPSNIVRDKGENDGKDDKDENSESDGELSDIPEKVEKVVRHARNTDLGMEDSDGDDSD
jgi:hypothetical protein